MKTGTTKNESSIWGFWFVIGGFLVRAFTHWLSPIHESMHGIVAVLLGGRITGMEQTKIWFILPNPSMNSLVILSGFWLEMFMYWSISMLWPQRLVGKAAAGIMPTLVVYGLLSTDFDRVRDIFPANTLLYPLVGGLLVIVLLGRHLTDTETTDTRPLLSAAQQLRR